MTIPDSTGTIASCVRAWLTTRTAHIGLGEMQTTSLLEHDAVITSTDFKKCMYICCGYKYRILEVHPDIPSTLVWPCYVTGSSVSAKVLGSILPASRMQGYLSYVSYVATTIWGTIFLGKPTMSEDEMPDWGIRRWLRVTIDCSDAITRHLLLRSCLKCMLRIQIRHSSSRLDSAGHTSTTADLVRRLLSHKVSVFVDCKVDFGGRSWGL